MVSTDACVRLWRCPADAVNMRPEALAMTAHLARVLVAQVVATVTQYVLTGPLSRPWLGQERTIGFMTPQHCDVGCCGSVKMITKSWRQCAIVLCARAHAF